MSKSWQKVGKKFVKILKRVGEEEEGGEEEFKKKICSSFRLGRALSHLVKMRQSKH
jgi:hypothetical protein